MEDWLPNNGNVNFDIWVRSVKNNNDNIDNPKNDSVLVREREYFLYFAERGFKVKYKKGWVKILNLTEEGAKDLFSSCFRVAEWYHCPELLNKFDYIEINAADLYRIAHGERDTELHKKLTQSIIDTELTGRELFVRTCNSSPKDTIKPDRSKGFDSSPLDNVHQILYTIATSSRCMSGFKSCNNIIVSTNLKLWYAPWQNLENFIHYRVFVRCNKVTAISQYDCLAPPTRPEIVRTEILNLWTRVSDTLWYEDVCLDVVHNETTGEIKIVEFNEFGCNSKAGAALFNWLQDFHILYLGDAVMKVNDEEEY